MTNFLPTTIHIEPLLSGGTNPTPIENLLNRPNIEIRRLDTLHAKVILGDRSAIIGSANLSTNDLNHEHDEDLGWIEAGMRTNVDVQLQEIGRWFEHQWELTEAIYDVDIEQARERWNNRRMTRIPAAGRELNFNNPLSVFRDLPIFVAIYRDDGTPQAKEAFKHVKNNAGGALQENQKLLNLDFFDQWDDLPYDASIISIYIGPRNGVRVDGVFRRLPCLDHSYAIHKEKYNIQVVIRENNVLNLPFGNALKQQLRQRLKNVITHYCNSETTDGECLSLYDALRFNIEIN